MGINTHKDINGHEVLRNSRSKVEYWEVVEVK